jgi:hypothetical protein
MSGLTKVLIEELQTAPDSVQREVHDFLVFLMERRKRETSADENLLVLAESAWAADWNTPEEDEAWRDL